jgi:hypothetical protein
MGSEDPRPTLDYATPGMDRRRRVRAARLAAGIVSLMLAVVALFVGWGNVGYFFPIPDYHPGDRQEIEQGQGWVCGSCCMSPIFGIVGTVLLITAFTAPRE